MHRVFLFPLLTRDLGRITQAKPICIKGGRPLSLSLGIGGHANVVCQRPKGSSAVVVETRTLNLDLSFVSGRSPILIQISSSPCVWYFCFFDPHVNVILFAPSTCSFLVSELNPELGFSGKSECASARTMSPHPTILSFMQ